MRKVKRYISRHPWQCILLGLTVFLLSAVILIYTFERKADPSLTAFDAVLKVLVFFLGEYGDTPQTPVGKTLSLILFIFGIAAGAALIGKIASLFVNIRLENTMPKDAADHIVICNWNDNADRIIQEIHSPLAAPDTEIAVISSQEINTGELKASPAYKNVFFINADPVLHDVLRKANAHKARSIIILADDTCQDPDARTALIALAISNLEKEEPRPPHMVAEVLQHHRIQHLYDAGVDEWVCSNDFGLGIIAQSAIYGKLSDVYQQLLTYSKDTNEIYLVEADHYPETMLGKTFSELSAILNQDRQISNPAVLMGIKRNDRIILNPRQDEFDTLKKEDSLVVMAFDPPDLKKISID